MLTHGNLLSQRRGDGRLRRLTSDDVLLSWLPYSHIYARTVRPLPDDPGRGDALPGRVDRDARANLAETQPTWMTAVPRFYEKVWASVEPLPAAPRAARLRAIFGPRLRQLSSGGAPLPRHVCEGFHAAGIPLLEGYGLTESSPVISLQPPRPLAGRHGRPADPGRRGQDRRRRRDPHPRASRDEGLLERPRGDRRRRSSTAGCTPATSAARRRRLPRDHRPQEGPDHHLGRQEHRPERAGTLARRATPTSTRPSSTATASRSSRP